MKTFIDGTREPEHLVRWTMPKNYTGESWPEYYRSGCGRSRDSDALERSNFTCMLEALGGESETVMVIHEGHWAVGWVEWIAIHESDAKALEIADEIAGNLKDYPVVNEDHWAGLETEEADEVWRDCYRAAERIAYIRKNPDQFEFRDFKDLIECVRGRYFAGYASELLS